MNENMETVCAVDICYFGLAGTAAIPPSLATLLVKESFPVVGIPFHVGFLR